MKSSSNSDLEVVYHPGPQTADQPVHAREEVVVERLRLLWDERTRLLKFAAWGLALATLIAFVLPKQFESATRLMPPDGQSRNPMAVLAALTGGGIGGLSAMAGDMLGMKSSGALFMGILTSRTVQDDLINKFDLKKAYGSTTYQSTRKRLAASTAIAEDHKSGIITITVTDSDPRRAAAMAEEYVAELNTVVNQLSTSSARRERVFLEERLSQVKQDLETAEKEFGDFASKNTAVDIKEQAKAMVGAAATLQGDLIAAESQLQGMKEIYTENNVRVRALRARIAELHSQLGKMGGHYEDPSSESAADKTDAKDDSLYPSIRKLPVLGVQFADLYRRTKIQETVFEVLTQQYEMAKVAEAKETPSVKVLDPSNVPERKSFPPRLLIMIIGMCSGFIVGVVVTVAHARWRQMDGERPAKILVRDVSSGVRLYLSGTDNSNGNGNSRPRSPFQSLRARLHRKASGE